MDIQTAIRLKDEIWKQFKITVPASEGLLKDFSQHVSKDEPSDPSDVSRFLAGEFRKYLEPISGFMLTKDYTKEEIERVAGPLVSVGTEMPWFFKDSKFGFYWSETERHGFGMHISGYHQLHGERPLR